MLDALLGMAVEGVKNLLSSEIGRHAVHVAAHKAGEAIEHHYKQSASRDSKKSSFSCPSCGARYEYDKKDENALRGQVFKCNHCGVTMRL